MSSELPDSFLWVLWALRGQVWVALIILLGLCWAGRKELRFLQVLSFLSPTMCLFVYYTDVIFIRPTNLMATTWWTLFFNFSMAWFFMGLAVVAGRSAQERTRLVKQIHKQVT